MRRAVLATEDRHFYEHGGVDPVGIARATVNDIRGGKLQGGSTITQQYVKNTYVGRERTVWRKLKEAVLAVKLERELTKDELLERYLNTVYFGRGAYGVQAAAQAWFGKDVGDLGLREAAYMAGLIRAPTSADVAKDPVTAEARRHRTLQSMVATHDITVDDQTRSRGAAVGELRRRRPNQAAPKVVAAEAGTEYVVDYVKRVLVRDYGEQATFGGGLRVTTNIDIGAQRAAYKRRVRHAQSVERSVRRARRGRRSRPRSRAGRRSRLRRVERESRRRPRRWWQGPPTRLDVQAVPARRDRA